LLTSRRTDGEWRSLSLSLSLSFVARRKASKRENSGNFSLGKIGGKVATKEDEGDEWQARDGRAAERAAMKNVSRFPGEIRREMDKHRGNLRWENEVKSPREKLADTPRSEWRAGVGARRGKFSAEKSRKIAAVLRGQLIRRRNFPRTRERDKGREIDAG